MGLSSSYLRVVYIIREKQESFPGSKKEGWSAQAPHRSSLPRKNRTSLGIEITHKESI